LGFNALDRGCQTLYQTGQPVTLHYRIDDPTGSGLISVAVYNITRQGTMHTLMTSQVFPGTEYRFNAEVGGNTGRNTVVLQTRLNDGSWITSFCSMHVRETASFREDFEFGNPLGLPWRHGGHTPSWFVTNSSWRPGQIRRPSWTHWPQSAEHLGNSVFHEPARDFKLLAQGLL
jgi:hypothetical protein